jgi:hypothetical protein
VKIDYTVRIEALREDGARKVGTVKVDGAQLQELNEMAITRADAVVQVATAALHRIVESMMEDEDFDR